jgi:hypothetical protein
MTVLTAGLAVLILPGCAFIGWQLRGLVEERFFDRLEAYLDKRIDLMLGLRAEHDQTESVP